MRAADSVASSLCTLSRARIRRSVFSLDKDLHGRRQNREVMTAQPPNRSGKVLIGSDSDLINSKSLK